MNEYTKDAINILKYTSRLISAGQQDNFALINQTLMFALGVERLLKGILYDINPLYILLGADFKNSAAVEYSQKIIPEMSKGDDVAQVPNQDVITFRLSLLRAQHFSKCAHKHKGFLFFLNEARDIIAHNRLSFLDLQRLKERIGRDFISILSDFESELNLTKHAFFDGQETKLRTIAISYQENVSGKLELKFQIHKEKWQMAKNISGYIQNKSSVTAEILQLENKVKTPCPACDNDAVLYLKSLKEYNPFEGREVQTGFEIKKLKCQYCKIEIVDYEEIDFLKLYDRFKIATSEDSGERIS